MIHINNQPHSSLTPELNRPRFYDDLEPISSNELSDNAEYKSYKVQNTSPLIIDDDMVCGYEEPQKRLKVQENKGIIVKQRSISGEYPNTRNSNTKVSLSEAQVLRNRRNYIRPSISQVINIDDDEEDEDSVEFISGDDDDCLIIDKPSQNEAKQSLVTNNSLSNVYEAIMKKRIEEEAYRRAVEYRQRQYFMGLQMRHYMNFMTNQNRIQQAAQQQWTNVANSPSQYNYSRGFGPSYEQSWSNNQSMSAPRNYSYEQRYQPLQVSIPLDKETDFNLMSQTEDRGDQNITTLEQKFYLEPSKFIEKEEPAKNTGRKRGRPRKYPLQAGADNDSNTVVQIKVKKVAKKPKVIETMVGEEFQVRIPSYSLNNKKEHFSKKVLKLVWDPDLIQKDTLDTFMEEISRVTRQEIPKDETVLQLLQSCGMDTAQTLELIRKNKQSYRKGFEVGVQNNIDQKF